MQSLVSIIVPCFKQAQYLNEALESVLHQSYTNWECIIVNDGSPDDTETVAKKWLGKDKRFKYCFQENLGVSAARNHGVTLANGEFILPLDADDKLGDSYITLAVKAFQKENNLKVVYCKAEKFGDEKGEWILKPFSLYNLSLKNMIFCSALYRKSEWERIGGYDSNMREGLEDWEFWIAMLKDGGEVKCLDCKGFYYRTKVTSRNVNFDFETRKELLEYLTLKHTAFFVKQLGSINYLVLLNENTKAQYEAKLKSEKFIINLFFKTFFKFKIFKNIE